jgi:hypothetical protein
MREGAASALAALLASYADPDPSQGPRLLDVPAEVGAQVLAMLPEDQVTARLNLVQPPMNWLVAHCADLGGRLVGSLVPGRGFVRFDGVQLGDVSTARALAESVAADWPATAGRALGPGGGHRRGVGVLSARRAAGVDRHRRRPTLHAASRKSCVDRVVVGLILEGADPLG